MQSEAMLWHWLFRTMWKYKSNVEADVKRKFKKKGRKKKHSVNKRMWKTNHETIGHNNKMKIQTLYARSASKASKH